VMVGLSSSSPMVVDVQVAHCVTTTKLQNVKFSADNVSV